jgi:GTPase involved in cell partitioning and DNA repair
MSLDYILNISRTSNIIHIEDLIRLKRKLIVLEYNVLGSNLEAYNHKKMYNQ